MTGRKDAKRALIAYDVLQMYIDGKDEPYRRITEKYGQPVKPGTKTKLDAEGLLKWATAVMMGDEGRQAAAAILYGEMLNIATANMQDYWEDDENGNAQFKGINNLTRVQAAAIQEWDVEEVMVSGKVKKRKTKFKLHPKIPAIKEMGQEVGIFNNKMEHRGSVEVTEIRNIIVPAGHKDT